MASFYCDHGCTLYPTAYMATPSSSSSLPQEGDGKASGTGATPAVASATQNFLARSAAAGATYSVHGATLTCVASGAGVNQFNAASGATLAANLAAAINAATASPTTTTGGVSSPYLKALVWATSSGSDLTVYTRIASADLNQSSNASAILACGTLGNWTSPPANANFSGGVSGPWSQAFNIVALGANINASIGAIGTYGGWIATMMGLPAGGDVLHMRTGRSSADIVIDLTTISITFSTRAIGSNASHWEVRFDNGAVWNDGNSNQVFEIRKSGQGAVPQITFAGYVHLKGQMKTGASAVAGGTVNFKWNYTATDSAAYGMIFYTHSFAGSRHVIIEGLETADSALGSYTGSNVLVMYQQAAAGVDSMRPTVFRNCKFGHLTRSASWLFSDQTFYGCFVELYDCLIAAGGAVTYPKLLYPAQPTGPVVMRLVRPKFTGGAGGHHSLIQPPSSPSNPITISIEDPVDMGQFIASDSAASVCGRVSPSTSVGYGGDDMIAQIISSNVGDRQYLHDTPKRLLEWRSAGFPTTGNSALPDGTLCTVRFSVAPTSLASGIVTPYTPAKGIKQVNVNTLGDSASLVLTERILLDTLYGGSSYTPTETEWWIEGSYVSSVDGSTKTFSTRNVGSTVTSDSTTWSSLSYSPFGSGSRSYNRWKIQATLTDVKDNTEVVCYLMCGKQPSVMTEWCFVDPEFGLA